MKTNRMHRALSLPLLIAVAGFLAPTASAFAAPTGPISSTAVASHTVGRTQNRNAGALIDEPIRAAARRPARLAVSSAKLPPAPAPIAAPARPLLKKAVSLIEDPVGVLMDLGGYTWLEIGGGTARRAGVLAEAGQAPASETDEVLVDPGQPHAVSPDLLFALLVEATRVQQHRIETLEAEALELRLALADAAEARDDQDRALASIQLKLGIKP